MKRGEVYDARLDPAEGSEQAGTRPVIIVTRDVINNSTVVVVVPCTGCVGQDMCSSQTLLRATDGGLQYDSVGMAEQVGAISERRLLGRRGTFPPKLCRHWIYQGRSSYQ